MAKQSPQYWLRRLQNVAQGRESMLNRPECEAIGIMLENLLDDHVKLRNIQLSELTQLLKH